MASFPIRLHFPPFYANLAFSFFLNSDGTIDKVASTPRMSMERQEKASLELVIVCSVFPAWIAITEGGATPKNVPRANGARGTPITGATRLINQLGKMGVMRRNNM